MTALPYRIRNFLNRYRRVLCVAVVGLAHVVHDDLQRTRCDLAASATVVVTPAVAAPAPVMSTIS